MSIKDYRLYSFTNMYLSSIQKGIQTAHIVSDMSALWCDNGPDPIVKKVFDDWADIDKTIIVLNGGNQKSLEEIYVCLELFGYEHSLPTARFYEDQESLGGALTAVGIILPIEIYELAASMRGIQYDPFSEGITPTTRNFINALNKCGLAN